MEYANDCSAFEMALQLIIILFDDFSDLLTFFKIYFFKKLMEDVHANYVYESLLIFKNDSGLILNALPKFNAYLNVFKKDWAYFSMIANIGPCFNDYLSTNFIQVDCVLNSFLIFQLSIDDLILKFWSFFDFVH